MGATGSSCPSTARARSPTSSGRRAARSSTSATTAAGKRYSTAPARVAGARVLSRRLRWTKWTAQRQGIHRRRQDRLCRGQRHPRERALRARRGGDGLHAAPPPPGRHRAERRADGGHRHSADPRGPDRHQGVYGRRRLLLHLLAPRNDKRKRDAAWEYIRFMTSDEAQAHRDQGLRPGRATPSFVRNPHWLEQFGYEEYFDEIDPQHLKAYDEALQVRQARAFRAQLRRHGQRAGHRHEQDRARPQYRLQRGDDSRRSPR